jgi:cytochrome c-type biogenesis protein CcmH
MYIIVAIAAVLTLAVLAVLLRPLWRDARRLAAGIGAVVAIGAVALYEIVGTPAALDPQARAAPATLDDAIAQLRAQLERDPTQVDGWRLLGQALATQQRLPQARDAYAEAAALAPNDPDVLVEAAQSRAMATSDRRFDNAAVALLQRALQAQPQHQRARWFLGIAQRQAGDDAAAVKTWEALLPQVDAKTAASLRPQIDAARAAAGLPPLPSAPAASNTAGLRVKVALDPELASRIRLRGDASVFVIARMPGGPPMPIAVEKHSVQELPFEATLDDGDSPMPTQKLSSQREVELVARLSSSGEAMPQAGDLESQPVRVKLPAEKPVELSIGTARP